MNSNDQNRKQTIAALLQEALTFRESAIYREMLNLWKEAMNDLYVRMLDPEIDGTEALKLLAEQRGVSRSMAALDALIEQLQDEIETLNLFEEEDNGTND